AGWRFANWRARSGKRVRATSALSTIMQRTPRTAPATTSLGWWYPRYTLGRQITSAAQIIAAAPSHRERFHRGTARAKNSIAWSLGKELKVFKVSGWTVKGIWKPRPGEKSGR